MRRALLLVACLPILGAADPRELANAAVWRLCASYEQGGADCGSAFLVDSRGYFLTAAHVVRRISVSAKLTISKTTVDGEKVSLAATVTGVLCGRVDGNRRCVEGLNGEPPEDLAVVKAEGFPGNLYIPLELDLRAAGEPFVGLYIGYPSDNRERVTPVEAQFYRDDATDDEFYARFGVASGMSGGPAVALDAFPLVAHGVLSYTEPPETKVNGFFRRVGTVSAEAMFLKAIPETVEASQVLESIKTNSADAFFSERVARLSNLELVRVLKSDTLRGSVGSRRAFVIGQAKRRALRVLTERDFVAALGCSDPGTCGPIEAGILAEAFGRTAILLAAARSPERAEVSAVALAMASRYAELDVDQRRSSLAAWYRVADSPLEVDCALLREEIEWSDSIDACDEAEQVPALEFVASLAVSFDGKFAASVFQTAGEVAAARKDNADAARWYVAAWNSYQEAGNALNLARYLPPTALGDAIALVLASSAQRDPNLSAGAKLESQARLDHFLSSMGPGMQGFSYVYGVRTDEHEKAPADLDDEVLWADGFFVRWPGGVDTHPIEGEPPGPE